MNYALFGKFTSKPEDRDKLASILLEASLLLAGNPDCFRYEISTSEEAGTVWVSELWKNKAAHDASLEPEEVRNLIMKAKPLITGMEKIAEMDVLE